MWLIVPAHIYEKANQVRMQERPQFPGRLKMTSRARSGEVGFNDGWEIRMSTSISQRCFRFAVHFNNPVKLFTGESSDVLCVRRIFWVPARSRKYDPEGYTTVKYIPSATECSHAQVWVLFARQIWRGSPPSAEYYENLRPRKLLQDSCTFSRYNTISTY